MLNVFPHLQVCSWAFYCFYSAWPASELNDDEGKHLKHKPILNFLASVIREGSQYEKSLVTVTSVLEQRETGVYAVCFLVSKT